MPRQFNHGTKKAGSGDSRPKKKYASSGVGLGLAETLHAIALFPLAAFLEQFDALKTFQDVAFLYDTTETLKAFMLGHEGKC
jgi:hypothetical protein